MMTPCHIELFSAIKPSEDPNKVLKSISNIFPNSEVDCNPYHVKATSQSLQSLEFIVEAIRSRQSQNACKRHLKQNLNGDSTWFYLNKQAAYARKVAICGETDESPLGPIKLTITSPQIGKIIDWITRTTKENSSNSEYFF